MTAAARERGEPDAPGGREGTIQLAKVLVIGGTGQISSEVTAHAVRFGHDVTVINRGRSRLPLPDGVSHIEADRSDPDGFSAAVEQALERGVTAVVDMICFKPEQARQMARVLQGKVKHYIFCSTVCVYGGHLPSVPAPESTPHRPVSQYGADKSECERILFEAHRRGDLPVTVFRPSYTLGRGGHPDSIWGRDPYLVDRIRKHKPILMLDSGNNLWHPASSVDVGRIIAAAIENDQAVGEDFNVNGPRIYTQREYFEALGEALNAPVELVSVPTQGFIAATGRQGSFVQTIFQYHCAFSNEKVRRKLGYEPSVSHEEAVLSAVEHLERRGMLKSSDESDRDDRVIRAVREYADGLVEAIARELQ